MSLCGWLAKSLPKAGCFEMATEYLKYLGSIAASAYMSAQLATEYECAKTQCNQLRERLE